MLTSKKFFFFFFNDTATTEIYTLSLHDALPICVDTRDPAYRIPPFAASSLHSRGTASTSRTASRSGFCSALTSPDRKSTRLNSSHSQISYAVFCLKKKKETVRGRYPLRPAMAHV